MVRAGADALELLEATGRDKIPVALFRVEDHVGRKFILPLTHEETFAFHARELQSYRQLPQSWYHFQNEDRDEPRPRGGLLRVREFVMKDSYSFDRGARGSRRASVRTRLRTTASSSAAGSPTRRCRPSPA